MKQRILAGVFMATATIAGGSGSWAAAVERPGPEMTEGPGRVPRGNMPRGDHVDHMAKMLGLSDTQQKQIKDILNAERGKNAALMEKMGGFRQQLHAAAQAATFDEAEVRAIATKQAQAEIELTVSRARVQSRINGVLTEEQRALEQKLRPPMGPGPGHPPPFHGER